MSESLLWLSDLSLLVCVGGDGPVPMKSFAVCNANIYIYIPTVFIELARAGTNLPDCILFAGELLRLSVNTTTCCWGCGHAGRGRRLSWL